MGSARSTVAVICTDFPTCPQRTHGAMGAHVILSFFQAVGCFLGMLPGRCAVAFGVPLMAAANVLIGAAG